MVRITAAGPELPGYPDDYSAKVMEVWVSVNTHLVVYNFREEG